MIVSISDPITETKGSTRTDLAVWVPLVTGVEFSAGATREARVGMGASREGSTTTSIFIGRSGSIDVGYEGRSENGGES